MPLGGKQVDVRGGLAVLDVLGGQHEGEPWAEVEQLEGTLDEGAAAARGDRLGDAGRFQCVEQVHESRHWLQTSGQQFDEDVGALGGQLGGRRVELVPVDHDTEGDVRLAAHHFVEQLARDLLAAPSEDNAADFLVELFGVEHQAVEVEGDGAEGRRGRPVVPAGMRVEMDASFCRIPSPSLRDR